MSEASRRQLARRYVVEGRVQGVGFRFYVLRAARELGLGGHVRNLPDGRVEVEAAGPPAELTAFEERLRQGPPAARVAAVGRQDIEGAGRRTFEIAD